MENEDVLVLTSTRKITPPSYSIRECKKQLMSEFRMINSKDIRTVMELHKGHYTESHMSLRLVMEKMNNQLQNMDNEDSETTSFTTMARERPCSNRCLNSRELEKEVKNVKENIKSLNEAASRQAALRLLEEDYAKMGQLIECACCYGECVFDNMAQCTEGHLVCVECLQSYTKEIAFGTGKIALGCMMPECTAEYPQCELRRCLDPKIRSKLEERTLYENLNAAQIKDLVRCPYCDFAAILPDNLKRFACGRDTCGKVTCRNCSNDWKDHLGKTCSMLESRDEASLRKEYEEKMTKAKVRTCTNCATEFTKHGGCNDMVCRCGSAMCYICRQPLNTEEDLLKHCNKDCPHESSTQQDDQRAIEELKREASMKRKELGYAGDREIGVPAAKKAKKSRF